MFAILLIIIIIILIILSDFCSNENMTNNYNKYLNNYTSIIVKNNIYNQDELIEITSLPSCNNKIIINYGSNNNPINNDSIKIYQIINDPKNNILYINNKIYYLIQIEWRKTNFTFNNKKVGLTLHLIHTDFKSSDKLIIIIPLDLVKNINNINIIENMENINHNKKFANVDNIISNINNIFEDTSNYINKFNLSINYKRIYNIKDININLLLKNKNIIPMYQCCKNTIGPVININLCFLKIIIETSKYYIIKEENGNTNYIIEPNILNEEEGLLIISYIQKDNNLLYLK